MTIADTIDLDFLAGSADDDEGNNPNTVTTADSQAIKVPAASVDETISTAAEDIADMFISNDAEQESEPEKKKPAESKTKDSTKMDPSLVRLAMDWGITSDEAHKYPSSEALSSAILGRKQLFIPRKTTTKIATKKEEKLETFKLPGFDPKLDEDSDPALINLGEQYKAHSADSNTKTEAVINRLQEKIDSMQNDSKAVNERASEATQVRLSQVFDEEVATWSEDFVELIGVPSQSIQSGNAEAKKLNDFVLQLQLGYIEIHGEPDPEAAVTLTKEYVRQGRYALWPEMADKKASKSLSKKLREQRGGVGLRPRQSRDSEPPEQGDKAAKNGIKSYMDSQGISLW